jgi:hypothetical protein
VSATAAIVLDRNSNRRIEWKVVWSKKTYPMAGKGRLQTSGIMMGGWFITAGQKLSEIERSGQRTGQRSPHIVAVVRSIECNAQDPRRRCPLKEAHQRPPLPGL